ncbi:MAG TPA: vWA domain-containing protein [Methylococcaceae bacterium]|jgi:mxaC protein|nr:vWA domain-containing protein [Methylococcaceae bacterium]
MNFAFSQPWVLLLGLLAAIPIVRAGQKTLSYSSIAMLPEDPLSAAIDRLLRLIAALAVASLVAGIAGPYLREQRVEKIGTGAHIVLLLDRSSSMNDNFSGRYLGGAAQESKGTIASKLLAEFVGRRRDDLFALVAFSAAPVYVLPLTQDREAVQAAIASLGKRGHGVTNIAPGLAMALDYFSGRPLTGSRIILLVSDGAARMDAETGDYIRQLFQNNRAALYWIYLRNPRGGSLSAPPENPNESTTPEYFLNQYFQTLGVPYRAYEADNPEAVQRAILDVEKLENQPLRYLEKLPRKDLSGWCYGTALICLSILLAFKTLEVGTWRP